MSHHRNNLKDEWRRVTKDSPCVCCQSSDWCMISTSGDVNCMRVESPLPMKSGGWIHKAKDDLPKYVPSKPKEPEIKLDCLKMWRKWHDETSLNDLRAYSDDLGVDPLSLAYLGCAWAKEHAAMAFPMRNHKGDIIGFRLRNRKGDKWSVKGSKQGLFYSRKVMAKPFYIVEGPTDAAAMLTLGLPVIGRPSCLGCEEMLNDTLKHFRIREAVLIPDADVPGQRGADKLQATMKINHCRITLPCKDAREFIKLGGTREVIESIVKSTIWEKAKL